MERVWRKVNQGLTMRSSSTKVPGGSATTGCLPLPASGHSQSLQHHHHQHQHHIHHSTDTTSSAGFGEAQQVVAVQQQQQQQQQRRRVIIPGAHTTSSEKRRRRRRRSRPNRGDGNSQGVGGGHSSADHHKNHISSSRGRGAGGNTSSNNNNNTQLGLMSQVGTEQSLRQRAVARLKMFNFNLNWDLHMNQCKPCGPKSGNIITRRLCRNRRGEDNELYRSNSFKFERFERKEAGGPETGTRTLRKQV